MTWIKSLAGFQLVAFVPHLLLYEFYLLFKYFIVLSEIIMIFKGKSASKNYASVCTVSLGFLVSCWCCLCCCFDCCFRRKGYFSSAVVKLYQLNKKLNTFLVKVLFGPKEGIVDRFATYKEDEEDNNGIPLLYIHNVKLGQREISLLAILIMAFGLLAAVTAWDSYFLDESYLCNEKSDISCYPIPLESDPNAYEELNLSTAQEHRITDCSYWNNENVSSRVSFVCFQWAYDSKAVVSDVGGLLTMFLLTMKIASSGFLAFLNWAIKKCAKKISNGEIEEDDIKLAVTMFETFRILLMSLTALLEIPFGVILVAITSYAISRNDSSIINFLYEHGNQLLLIFGIFSTLLLLPLETYAMSEQMPNANMYDEEKGLPSDKNVYEPLLHNATAPSVNIVPGDFQETNV